MADTDEPIAKRLRRSQRISKPSAATPAKSPETELPNSILHLTDACLEKIIGYLDVDGLCQTANVCKRLRDIAEQVFAKQHTEFQCKANSFTNSVFRRVLSKFGKLITSIDAADEDFDEDIKIDMNAIVKYCGPKLESLYLRDAKINCDVVKSLFAQLIDLELQMCDFVGDTKHLFSNCPKLETLSFEAKGPCDFLIKKFPKLKGLTFDCGHPGFFTYIGILKQNPSLKYLHLMAMAEDIHIEYVVECAKNLERLMIRSGFMAATPEVQTRKGFLLLSKLTKLKKLALDAGDENYAKLVSPLMDSFAKSNVQLDQLDLGDFRIKAKDIESILKIKSLEKLILHKIEDVSDDDLVPLTANLPLLTNLQLYFDNWTEKPISAKGLTEIVNNGKQLECVVLVGVRNLEINQEIYDNLLKAIDCREEQKKLTIDIIGCQSTCGFDVPENIWQPNTKQIHIKFNATTDCECDDCIE